MKTLSGTAVSIALYNEYFFPGKNLSVDKGKKISNLIEYLLKL